MLMVHPAGDAACFNQAYLQHMTCRAEADEHGSGMVRAHFVFRVTPCHYAIHLLKASRDRPGQPANDRLKSIIEAPDFHI
jgi:hypothetical protein